MDDRPYNEDMVRIDSPTLFNNNPYDRNKFWYFIPNDITTAQVI
jgi:hypothetical protein